MRSSLTGEKKTTRLIPNIQRMQSRNKWFIINQNWTTFIQTALSEILTRRQIRSGFVPSSTSSSRDEFWFKYTTQWRYICIRSWFLKSSSSNKAGRFLKSLGKSLQRKSPYCFLEDSNHSFISPPAERGRAFLSRQAYTCSNASLTSLPKCSPSEETYFGQINVSVNDNFPLSSPVKHLLSILVTSLRPIHWEK